MEITKIETEALYGGGERTWFLLNGTHHGTGIVFDNDEYAVDDDGTIIDANGCPLTEGDGLYVAVNSLIN